MRTITSAMLDQTNAELLDVEDLPVLVASVRGAEIGIFYDRSVPRRHG